jgi:glycosyltransferase involved in cell wall biosynthesis
MHKAHKPDAGVPVLRFFHPRLTSWWRAMKVVDADIYYQRSSAILTAIVAEFCRLNGKRSVYASASDMDFRPGHEPIRFARDRWLFHRGLRRVDRLVAQNRAQQQDCEQIYGRPATIIPSCYELPPTAKPGKGDTVLWVANMRKDKRPHIFLDIAQRLPHRKFVMVGAGGGGDPAEMVRFEQARARAATLPNVTMTGFLPMEQAEALFDAARVVVNTSRYEGMPNTFLQAWARGVPTHAFIDVGARVRGEPIYEVSTTADEAAVEIERHFTDPAYYAGRSARSLEYFDAMHSLEHVVGEYSVLLDDLHPAGKRSG